MNWSNLLIIGCSVVAAWLWIARPARRSAAYFALGISATAAASAVKLQKVWWSIGLSILAIVLFVTALWLQRREMKR